MLNNSLNRKKNSELPKLYLSSFAVAMGCLGLSASLLQPLQAHADLTRSENALLGAGFHMPLYRWEDQTQSKKGVVVLVHGLTEHALSLDAFAKKLAQRGYLVLAIDQRGHGAWHVRDRKGETGYKLSYDSSVRDLKSVLISAHDDNPALLIFLVGESLGAAVALGVASEAPVKIDGLVLTGCCDKTERFRTHWILGDL